MKLDPLFVFNVETKAAGHKVLSWYGLKWIVQTELFYSGGILKSRKWLLFENDLSQYKHLYKSIDAIIQGLTRELEVIFPQYKLWLMMHHLSDSQEHFKTFWQLQKDWHDLKSKHGSWHRAWLAEPDKVEQLERLLA